MNGLIEMLQGQFGWIAVCGLFGLLLLLFVGRRIIWWLFRFDKDVAQILSQAKSSEVRTGKIVESLAPILSDFPVDVTKEGTATIFLGQPVDYVHFDPQEGVAFIEVKSGGAQLSETQRKIKSAIESGKVAWKVYRVD